MADKYQILNAMKASLAEKLGDNLKDVILGTNEDSDYDFLIILKEKPDSRQNFKPHFRQRKNKRDLHRFYQWT